MKTKHVTILIPASLESLAGASAEKLGGANRLVEALVYETPQEAIKLISGQRIDLVLLDAGLKGDNRGLIAVTRQSEPAIPVVCALPEGHDAGEKKPFAEYVFDFLDLPLDKERAFLTIRNALQCRDFSLQLSEKEHELVVLDEIGRTIISSLELKTVLNIIMEKTRQLVRSEAWTLFLIDEKSQELVCSAAIGEHAESFRQFRLKLGEGVAGWVAREAKPLVIGNGVEDSRFYSGMDAALGFETRSILCVPLETRGKVLGVLEVINKKGEEGFNDRDLNLVTKLAGFAAVAIENARLYHQAKLLTLTDELTQLYNSRFFNQFLESEVKRCRRYDSHVSLIFLDLDFFKKVNDQHGHLMGSKTLQQAADILREGLRDVDIVARYGGDEFLVILPETRIEEAARVAERMRASFESATFLVEDGINAKVTASFGVASFPEFSSSKEELVRFADQAMYRVKNESRNGVFVVDDPSIFSEDEESTK